MAPDSAACAVAPPLNFPDPSARTRRADDIRWFMEEIRPHEAGLRAYLRGRFSSLQDVDDLVQETYARLLRAREVGRASLTRAYLFTVARNVALDVVRHQHAVPITALEEIDRLAVVEEQPDAAEALSHQQELELLDEAIRALPPRCGEIIRLRRIAGLSYQAIAARLGITESTVNAQLALGLIRCRHYLSAHGVVKARIHGR
jgi:RNA polymerase sigma-70 factor (ECF subfamily)